MSYILNKWRDEGFYTLLLTLVAGLFLGISFFGRFSDKSFDPDWVPILLCGIPIVFGAIILAGFGLLNPLTAALVHNLGSVFVVVNSAMLLGYQEY